MLWSTRPGLRGAVSPGSVSGALEAQASICHWGTQLRSAVCPAGCGPTLQRNVDLFIGLCQVHRPERAIAVCQYGGGSGGREYKNKRRYVM